MTTTTSDQIQPTADNPWPVDSTYYPCCRGIGNHGPDCKQERVRRLRELVTLVDPADLTYSDRRALIHLIAAAFDAAGAK